MGRHMDRSITQGRRLVVTERAHDELAKACRNQGPQVLLLTWPGGAVALPLGQFEPSGYDVIIAHIARCPVYADVRQVEASGGEGAVLDVRRTVWDWERPRFRLTH
ncbi:MAG TPA: hypothetical protein VE441_15575 [Mycobacterium sp.]|nr:hypothetical protein [Mycobacterium sp.]